MRLQFIRSQPASVKTVLPACFTLAALALSVNGPAAHAQNLLTNGGFETSTTSVTPWTTSGNGNVYTYATGDTGTGVQASYGANDFIFNKVNTTQNGILAQTFATTAGKVYIVNFLYGDYSNLSTATTQTLKVSLYNGSFSAAALPGTSFDSQSFTASAAGVSQDFTTMFGSGDSIAFQATGSTTTLAFADQVTSSGTISTDGILDNVVVQSSTLPEPGALSLAALGALPLIGFLRSACRRKSM